MAASLWDVALGWWRSGVVPVALAAVGFSLQSALIQAVEACGVPSLQVVAVRCLLVDLAAVAVCARRAEPLVPPREAWPLLVAHSAVRTAAVGFNFFALGLLPLADATVVVFTYPVISGLLSRAVLKEPWGAFELAGSILSLSGTALVARPPALGFDHGGGGGGAQSSLGFAAAGVGACFIASGAVVCRLLGQRHTVDQWVVLHWFNGFSALVCFPLGYALQGLVAVTAETFALQLLMSVVSCLAQVAYFHGLAVAKGGAGRVMPFTYIEVAGSAAWGVLFFGDGLAPATLGGVALVMLSAVASWLKARRQDRLDAAAAPGVVELGAAAKQLPDAEDDVACESDALLA